MGPQSLCVCSYCLNPVIFSMWSSPPNVLSPILQSPCSLSSPEELLVAIPASAFAECLFGRLPRADSHVSCVLTQILVMSIRTGYVFCWCNTQSQDLRDFSCEDLFLSHTTDPSSTTNLSRQAEQPLLWTSSRWQNDMGHRRRALNMHQLLCLNISPKVQVLES